MIRRMGDPDSDFEAVERDYDEWLATRPKCRECGQPIEDDHYYFFWGVKYCPACVEGFRREMEEWYESVPD